MLASVRRPISTGGLHDGINPVIPYFDGLHIFSFVKSVGGLMDKAWDFFTEIWNQFVGAVRTADDWKSNWGEAP